MNIEAPVPISPRFFVYYDENNRRVTVAGDAIVETIEAPQADGSLQVLVNYCDGAPDNFTGKLARQFLDWWVRFQRLS